MKVPCAPDGMCCKRKTGWPQTPVPNTFGLAGPNPAMPISYEKIREQEKQQKEEEKKMPVVDMKATGENIRMVMKKAGVSVRDVRDACGFTTGNTVYRWLQGASLPAIESMVVLAHLCHVTINDIVITTTTGAGTFCA